MSPLIHTTNKQIEFTKKFNTQLRLDNFLIGSNFIVWLIAIFLLGGCGSSSNFRSHAPLDKGDYTSTQCLKISKARSSFAKRPLSRQGFASAHLYSRQHK